MEDMRIPEYVKTSRGPRTGGDIVMEREYLSKFGRALLGATTKPKLGLSARNCGVVYERCAELDSPRTTRTSQLPAVHALGGDRYCSRGGRQPGAGPRPAEVKGHYLNVTPLRWRDMSERAAFAREIGSVSAWST